MSRDGGAGEEVRLPGRIRHNRLLPARVGEHADWPPWVDDTVRAALRTRGIDAPWRHQVEAADAAWRGRHVVLTTGTASGKSLGYLLPIIAATCTGATPGDISDRTTTSHELPVSAPRAVALSGHSRSNRTRSPEHAPDQESLFSDVSPPPESLESQRSPSLGSLGSLDSVPTGPANGPVVQWRQRPHTALYLAPTKALAHDQLRRCAELGLERWRIAVVDGDCPPDERDWARDYASFVFTNPDLLHYSLLPGHAGWRGLLQSLRFVVVDEAHRYRGVFGAHVAAVLRRLRRLAAHYGAQPTFVLASATAGDGPATAAALTGVDAGDIVVVDRDTSTRGAVDLTFWEPDSDAEDLTAALLTDGITQGRQTIAFVASRRSTETIALRTRDQLAPRGVSPDAVQAYRGGYLASDRRRIEAALQRGQLLGIAATNALELGVDIAGVDSVVICGYPGSRAAVWQQAGRAGRQGNDAAVSLVARRQPLDAYLLDHPSTLFENGVEIAAVHPDNPYVLGPHLAAAAQELPVTEADRGFFGESTLHLAARLAAAGRLRKRPGGYYWTSAGRAVDTIDLRSARGDALDIIEEDTGRVLGHVEASSADLVAHPGAVYLHLGETYLCEEWDRDEQEILVRAARPGYLTQPQQRNAVTILDVRDQRRLGQGQIHIGEVEVTSQVTGYLRRDLATGRVWDSTPLELPERRTRTTAVWWTLDGAELPPELLAGSAARLDAGVHAAEHLSLALLPAFATCDRWDVGAHSDPHHPQTGAVTVFVHDQHDGGTGFAGRAFGVAEQWLRACLDRVRECDCEVGCPACILAPCGSNRALDPATATTILQRLLR